MAFLTTIQVRRGGKLTKMLIAMAVRAGREPQFVHSRCARGNVAFTASDCRMLSFQRIRRGRVFLQSKGGRFEALHRVTRRAFTTVCTLYELSSMRIRSMAIRALSKCNRSGEVSTLMTALASDAGMFAQQWVPGLVVIEIGLDHQSGNLSPRSSRMT
jgi:hypothetical protein